MTEQEYYAVTLYIHKMSDDDLLKEFVAKRSTRNSSNDEERDYYALLRIEIEDRKLLQNIGKNGIIRPAKEITNDAISEETNSAEKITRETYKKRCKEECKRRKLAKGEMISRQGKYAIAKAIGLDKLESFDSFKSGAKSYHRISRILSELGYSQKPSKMKK
jgi:hypothetical protein